MKIPPRAEITQPFKDALVRMSAEKLRKIQEDLSFLPPRQAQLRKRELAPALLRLNGIRKNPQSMDFLLTRLRSLPYTRYDFIASGTTEYFFAVSKDIQIVDLEHQLIFDMGPYQVYIPFNSLINENMETFMFLPARAPRSEYRHPHHYAGGTCWGGFNGIISALLEQGEIVELFRNIQIYLSRYDPHSVLHGHLETRVGHDRYGLNRSLYPFVEARPL